VNLVKQYGKRAAQRKRGLFENLMLSDPAQKFIAFVQFDGLLQCSQRSPPSPIAGALCEVESIHSFPHYWFRTCFNVIYLPYLHFSNQKCICMFNVLYTCSVSPSQL